MLQFLKMDKEMVEIVQKFQGYTSEIEVLTRKLEKARIEAQASEITHQKNEILKAKVEG